MGREENYGPETEEIERGPEEIGRETEETGRETEKKRHKKRAGKKSGRAGRKFLSLLQHIALAVMVIAVFVVAGASGFRVDTFQDTYTLGYSLYDQSKSYEDTGVFTSLFGWALSDVVRHGVVSGQMETDGDFDGSKVIDVTAYNYRQTELPEQYVTVEYRLEDLLKWQSYGFETRTETMTPEQADAFLADRTMLTLAPSESADENAEVAVTESDSRAGDGLYQTDVSGNLLSRMWVYTGGDGYQAEAADEAYTADGMPLLTEQYAYAGSEDYDGGLERNNILVGDPLLHQPLLLGRPGRQRRDHPPGRIYAGGHLLDHHHQGRGDPLPHCGRGGYRRRVHLYPGEPRL